MAFSEYLGVRVISLFSGTLPMILIVSFMPFIGLYNGDVQLPDILLSDLYASKPIYAAFLLFGYCSCASTAAFSFVEYSRFLREKSRKLGPPAGLISVLLIFVILPNLYLLLGFQFEETHEEGQNFYLDIWSKPWSELVPWFIHVVSATILFITFGLCSAVYLVFIYPHIKDGQTEPLGDVLRKKWFCSSLATIVPVAAFIRLLHIAHSRYFWGFPLLFCEISMISIAGMLVCVGNMETMKQMDKQYPILTMRGLCDLLLGAVEEETTSTEKDDIILLEDESTNTATTTSRDNNHQSTTSPSLRVLRKGSSSSPSNKGQQVVIQNINVITTDSFEGVRRGSSHSNLLLTTLDSNVSKELNKEVHTNSAAIKDTVKSESIVDEEFENAKTELVNR